MSVQQSYILEIYISSPNIVNDKPRIINIDSIISMELTESVLTMLPKIDLVLADKGNLIDRYPILDKDIINVTLNIVSDTPETEINVAFVISSFNVVDTQQNNGNVVRLSGYLSCSNMFSPHRCSDTQGSSNEIIQRIAKDTGLKFRSNDNGYESIYWYQNSNNYRFLNHVAERSFIPSDGVFVYGDTEGYINYMSLSKVMSHSNTFIAKYDLSKMQEDYLLESDHDIMYYDKYDVLNNSEVYNNMSNYGGGYGFYNLDGYHTQSISNMYKRTDILNVHKNYIGHSTFVRNIGIVSDDKLSNTIYKGRVQNQFARYQLFTNTISLNIRNTTNVKLMDNVDLQLESTRTDGVIMEPYSGEYIVGAISRSIIKDGNPGYIVNVLLCRHGMNKSDNEIVNYDRVV